MDGVKEKESTEKEKVSQDGKPKEEKQDEGSQYGENQGEHNPKEKGQNEKKQDEHSNTEKDDGNCTEIKHNDVEHHKEEPGKGEHKKSRKKLYIALGLLILIIVATGITLLCRFLEEPIVQVIGKENEEIEYGSEYVDEGLSVYTKFKNISNDVLVENGVDTSKIGTYYVTYKVPYRNSYKTYTRTVVVRDTTQPVITLQGSEEVNLEYGTTYEEPGYQAVDGYDGDITSAVVVKKVDLDDGSYDNYYEVEDSSGNKAEQVRHIKISDTTPPQLKLKGNSFISLVKGAKYEEQGVTAIDNKDGDISNKVIIEGNDFDTSESGQHKITYKVSDSSGNESTLTRNIVIGDSQATGVIYLTFDDGPSANTTPKILDVLKEKGVYATFFILNYNDSTEYLVKREVAEGHAIGIHGYSHDYAKAYASVEACLENITKLQDKIFETTGIKTMIVRFPGGSSNTVSKKYCPGVMTKISEIILSRGFKYYDWNVASGDSGDVKTKEGVYNNVTKGLKPGRNNIVLMHDFSGNNKTLEALPDIIDYGLSNGYKFEVITTDTEMVRQKIQN